MHDLKTETFNILHHAFDHEVLSFILSLSLEHLLESTYFLYCTVPRRAGSESGDSYPRETARMESS